MGYTHYYHTKPTLNLTEFFKVSQDMKKMLGPLEHLGVKLGDGLGKNYPYIGSDEIIFNGYSKCGHEERDLGITWPKPGAKGILKNGVLTKLGEITSSHWFAGAELESRVCGGDCSHETFSIMCKSDSSPDKETGYVFDCTKTAYKPYDLAVNVVLIIAKHYLKDDIVIRSDGDDSNWIEGKQLVQHFLGYGEDFKLDSSQILENAKKNHKEEMKIHYEKQAAKIDMTKVEVNDIFERSWGYDQTNVNFVKVVQVTKSGKSAYVVPIGSKSVESMSSMSGTVIADPQHLTRPDEKPRILRMRKYNDSSSLYLGEYHKWDGKPCYTSSYA